MAVDAVIAEIPDILDIAVIADIADITNIAVIADIAVIAMIYSVVAIIKAVAHTEMAVSRTSEMIAMSVIITSSSIHSPTMSTTIRHIHRRT